MQLRDPIRLITLEPVPEGLGEQVVKSEPLIVDAVQEEILLFDLFENLLCACDPGERDGETAADSIGNRGRQQEVQHRRFQCVEHVLGEELTDRVVATCHGTYQLRRVIAGA
jgi:hypothetical protein